MTKSLLSLRTILKDMGWPTITDSLLHELCSDEEVEELKNNNMLKLWANKSTESENAYFIDFSKTIYPHIETNISNMTETLKDSVGAKHTLDVTEKAIKNLNELIEAAKYLKAQLTKDYIELTEKKTEKILSL